MKIDSNGLKTLYREYVRSQTPDSREVCPSVEQLVQVLRGGGREKEKTRVLDHLTRCSECAREFEFALEAVRAESAMIQDLEGREARESAGRRRPFYLSISWGLASLLVAAFAAGFLIWKLAVSPAPETYRATAAAKLELIQPGPDPVELASLAFRWKGAKGANSYIVEVYDEALVPLWKSEPVTRELAIPPESLKMRLAAGRRYFWMVSARFPEGDTLVSSLREFGLRD